VPASAIRAGSLACLLVLIPTNAQAATETPIRVTPGPDEYRASMGEGLLAWTQSADNKPRIPDVYAQVGTGAAFRVNSRRTDAFTGGIDGTRLAFSEYRVPRTDKTNADVRIVDLLTRKRLGVPGGINTPNWEYTPSISGSRILFGRISTGRKFFQKLYLHDSAAGGLRQLDALGSPREILYVGQVNGDYAVWHKCVGSVCDVFRYHIPSGVKETVPNPGRLLHYTPGVSSDGVVYFFESAPGCGANPSLLRWDPAGGTVILVDFPAGVDGTNANVFDDAAGTRHVVYTRVLCGQDNPAPADLYQILD
jgi:hypothetical protein